MVEPLSRLSKNNEGGFKMMVALTSIRIILRKLDCYKSFLLFFALFLMLANCGGVGIDS